MLAETVLGHVHDLGPALGVLKLRQIDIDRSDACLFEGRCGGVDGWSTIEAQRDGRRKDLKRTEPPGSYRT